MVKRMEKNNNYFQTVWVLLKDTINRSKISEPVLYAAAIAFFTLFSMPPTLNIIKVIGGRFFGEQAVIRELDEQIHRFVGDEGAEQIHIILEHNPYESNSHTILTIAEIAVFLFSATVAFSFIQKAINSIWKVESKPRKGILAFVIDRLISFSMVVTLAVLLLISLVLDPLLILLHDFLEIVVEEIHMGIMYLVNFILSFFIVTSIFAIMFKYLPDAKVKWRNVWIGAMVTTLLFKVGNYLISLILRETDIASAYGTAGPLAAILLWIFYSTTIFLIGAEFTYVYSQMNKKITRPGKIEDNVKVKEVKYVAPQRFGN
jgi:membrane protein